MKVDYHIIASFAFSSCLYFYLHSFYAAVISFLAGIFIDVDHFIDYTFQYRSIDIKHFFTVFTRPYLLINYYLVFHSVEFIIIFWLVIFKFKLGLFWVSIAAGFTQHLIVDVLFNRHLMPYFYFFTARLLLKFKKDGLLKAK